jgi:hypothetical protein
VQQSFCDATRGQFFAKLPSIKGHNDLTIKWNISELTSTGCSEEQEN